MGLNKRGGERIKKKVERWRRILERWRRKKKTKIKVVGLSNFRKVEEKELKSKWWV